MHSSPTHSSRTPGRWHDRRHCRVRPMLKGILCCRLTVIVRCTAAVRDENDELTPSFRLYLFALSPVFSGYFCHSVIQAAICRLCVNVSKQLYRDIWLARLRSRVCICIREFVNNMSATTQIYRATHRIILANFLRHIRTTEPA